MKGSKLILIFFSFWLLLPKFGIATDFISSISKPTLKTSANGDSSHFISDMSLLDIEDDDEVESSNKKTSLQNVSTVSSFNSSFNFKKLILFTILNQIGVRKCNPIPRYKLNRNYRI